MKTVLLLALLASVSANFEEEVSYDRFGVPLSCPSGLADEERETIERGYCFTCGERNGMMWR